MEKREIIFRGKRKDNGEWTYGVPIQRKGGTQLIYSRYSDAGGFIEVDPSTVCQYTGMPDKNGRKIFEGDIVRFDDCSNYPIFWDSDHYAFGSCWYSDFDHLSKYKNVEMEVIGNIFDNPELVGGAEK